MPSVLILGGLGFIGRHLVDYLVTENLADTIRVVDKSVLATTYMNEKHKKNYASVEVMQGNLANQRKIQFKLATET